MYHCRVAPDITSYLVSCKSERAKELDNKNVFLYLIRT